MAFVGVTNIFLQRKKICAQKCCQKCSLRASCVHVRAGALASCLGAPVTQISSSRSIFVWELEPISQPRFRGVFWSNFVLFGGKSIFLSRDSVVAPVGIRFVFWGVDSSPTHTNTHRYDVEIQILPESQKQSLKISFMTISRSESYQNACKQLVDASPDPEQR